jgi:hypothetical protein
MQKEFKEVNVNAFKFNGNQQYVKVNPVKVSCCRSAKLSRC